MTKQTVITPSRIQIEGKKGLLNNGIVMDLSAKRITEQFCTIVGDSKGDILDIGFGLGISANYFLELGVKSYTCIEIDEQVYQTALEWSEDKPNVTIIKGDWFDILPTLNTSYDGIYMDTYGDDFAKYSKFEQYAKLVARENACLGIWEYPQIRPISSMNSLVMKTEQKGYDLLLKPLFNISWTYFVAGEFRKKKFFKREPKILTQEQCQYIIEKYKDKTVKEETQALVDGILHHRRVKWCAISNDKSIEDWLKGTIFKDKPKFSLKGTLLMFYCLEEGDRYDRHVDTVKNIRINDPKQRDKIYHIQLNEGYEGGELDIFGIWLNSDRKHYSRPELNQGDCIEYRPYQHATNHPVKKGTQYFLQLFTTNEGTKRLKKVI